MRYRMNQRTMTVFMALAMVCIVFVSQASAEAPYQLASARPVGFNANSMQLQPVGAPSYRAPTATPSSYGFQGDELHLIQGITAEVERANVRLGQFEQRMIGFEGQLREVVSSQNSSLAELQVLKVSVTENTQLALQARDQALAAEQRAIAANQQAAQALQQVQVAEVRVARANELASQANAQADANYMEAQQARAQAAQALAQARAADEAARPKGIGKLFALLIPGLRHQ